MGRAEQQVALVIAEHDEVGRVVPVHGLGGVHRDHVVIAIIGQAVGDVMQVGDLFRMGGAAVQHIERPGIGPAAQLGVGVVAHLDGLLDKIVIGVKGVVGDAASGEVGGGL